MVVWLIIGSLIGAAGMLALVLWHGNPRAMQLQEWLNAEHERANKLQEVVWEWEQSNSNHETESTRRGKRIVQLKLENESQAERIRQFQQTIRQKHMEREELDHINDELHEENKRLKAEIALLKQPSFTAP